ncbi:MAG: hypothetical protein AAGB04_29100 [Pseudomonadota bacterium]
MTPKEITRDLEYVASHAAGLYKHIFETSQDWIWLDACLKFDLQQWRDRWAKSEK